MRTTNSYIKVNEDAKMKLARVFDVEPKTVYLALTGRRNSDKARKIRYAAVRAGSTISVNHQVAWLGVIFGLRRRSVLDVRD